MHSCISYLPFKIFDERGICIIVVTQLRERTRPVALIPVPDFLLQVCVCGLQSSHVVQVGRQAVVEVLHGHLFVPIEEAVLVSKKTSTDPTSQPSTTAVETSPRGSAPKSTGRAGSGSRPTARIPSPEACSSTGPPTTASWRADLPGSPSESKGHGDRAGE